jgi:hypothetical protein
MDADAAAHTLHCALLKVVGDDKGLKREEASFVRLLFSMLARCSTAASAGLVADDTAAQQAGGGGSGGGSGGGADDIDGSAEGAAAVEGPTSNPSPGYEALEAMMVDDGTVPRQLKREKQWKVAARYFVAMLPPKAAAPVSPAAPTHIPTSILEQLKLCPGFRSSAKCAVTLSRGPLNGFGLWNMNGDSCGFGFFPVAAMVNHSCVPTVSGQLEGKEMCFYATKDLRNGEEITWAYTNLLSSTDGMSRQENIRGSWGTVRVFRQKFTLEDAIGSHACSLQANMRVTNGIPLGSSLFLPVHTVNCVQTLKGLHAGAHGAGWTMMRVPWSRDGVGRLGWRMHGPLPKQSSNWSVIAFC